MVHDVLEDLFGFLFILIVLAVVLPLILAYINRPVTTVETNCVVTITGKDTYEEDNSMWVGEIYMSDTDTVYELQYSTPTGSITTEEVSYAIYNSAKEGMVVKAKQYENTYKDGKIGYSYKLLITRDIE